MKVRMTLQEEMFGIVNFYDDIVRENKHSFNLTFWVAGLTKRKYHLGQFSTANESRLKRISENEDYL